MTKLTLLYPGYIDLPLREGIHKQVLWLAAALSEDFDVHVVCMKRHPLLSQKTHCKKHEDISIQYVPLLKLINIKTDVLHILQSTPSLLSTTILIFSRYKRSFMSFFGGGLVPYLAQNRSIRFKVIKHVITKKTNCLFIQTRHQESAMKNHFNSYKLVAPLMPESFSQTESKTEKPSLLFMSQLTRHKNALILFHAFKELQIKYPDIILTIADSNLNKIKKNSSYETHLKKLICDLKNVILKDIVNPQEELSKAWIYVYPFVSADGTFSVPLSLYEAYKTNTFFVSSNVGGVGEFFNCDFLINPNVEKELTQKLSFILENYKQLSCEMLLTKSFNNKDVIQQIKQIYLQN